MNEQSDAMSALTDVGYSGGMRELSLIELIASSDLERLEIAVVSGRLLAHTRIPSVFVRATLEEPSREAEACLIVTWLTTGFDEADEHDTWGVSIHIVEEDGTVLGVEGTDIHVGLLLDTITHMRQAIRRTYRDHKESIDTVMTLMLTECDVKN